ncbi:predicted protein [Verticillium alfalfae VaMs.102]|uniref:Predicted protein n=1 Tax=Verticillium alfalfae (strain VaMs.102 / ATCC MYA-4576 / FGSC 10136) TaxID=526221 RepID=C9SNM1_VERA1|nr:predicted protein [Verticillium alfalfae VaMs.102]EEY20386.1 predicted protein [Verticillium alfalfae VaMs.102]
MAGTTGRKRAREGKVKPPQPTKKQKRQNLRHYDRVANDSEEEEEGAGAGDFKAVDLLDSDSDDIHNAAADDGAESAGSISSGDEAPRGAPEESEEGRQGSETNEALGRRRGAEADRGLRSRRQ